MKKNPNLHKEDSQWKIRKIIPLLDRFIVQNKKNDVNLLDVGGGSGVILKEVSKYLEIKHNIKVNKFALDLSPGILEKQKETNYDLKLALNEDIANTSLNDKEIDLTMMIDVLEHVKDPEAVLTELKRISNFVIFKVPLENNLYYNFYNIVTMNRLRRSNMENLGHIQTYDIKRLKSELNHFNGTIVHYYYANFSEYALNNLDGPVMNYKGKFIYTIASYVYKISPRISSWLFLDFAMVLTQC